MSKSSRSVNINSIDQKLAEVRGVMTQRLHAFESHAEKGLAQLEEKMRYEFLQFQAHMWERHGNLERVLHTGMDSIKKECVEENLAVAEAGGIAIKTAISDLRKEFEYLEHDLHSSMARCEGRVDAHIG